MGATEAQATKILVVEDAREFSTTIERVLTADGFEVEVVADGLEAVERTASFEPAMVVLDLGLPTLDGVEVCRRIRAFSDAYVIMLTARDDETDILIGLAVGADDYLVKPFKVASCWRGFTRCCGALDRLPA